MVNRQRHNAFMKLLDALVTHAASIAAVRRDLHA
ncbi:MAG: hypothetical protein RL032_871, partial [Pseudomonadota bacterium]